MRAGSGYWRDYRKGKRLHSDGILERQGRCPWIRDVQVSGKVKVGQGRERVSEAKRTTCNILHIVDYPNAGEAILADTLIAKLVVFTRNSLKKYLKTFTLLISALHIKIDVMQEVGRRTKQRKERRRERGGK
jgi:hypothetical protein